MDRAALIGIRPGEVGLDFAAAFRQLEMNADRSVANSVVVVSFLELDRAVQKVRETGAGQSLRVVD